MAQRFDPAVELNADPATRPAEDDVAGWLRFHAGGFYRPGEDEYCPWGEGRWQYDGDCRSCAIQDAADVIDALRG